MKGPITGCEHLIAKFAAWKFETSILPGKVSDISRLLLSYIQLFVQVFVPQIMNAITDLHAIVYRSSPSLPVKHSCAETYHRTGLRRVLHRVFCLRSHRLHTMTGGSV